MKKVLGLGNALVDVLLKVDDKFVEDLRFKKGSMNHIDKMMLENIIDKTRNIKKSLITGGSVANSINGLAKLGVKTGYLGKVGNDENGEFFNQCMIDNNINAKLFRGNAGTGTAVCMISKDSERTFATYLGSSIELRPDDLYPELFENYEYFYLEGYMVQDHKLVQRALELAKNAGALIAIDLASFNIVEENRDFLIDMTEKYIDIVFANEDEAKAFTGYTDPDKALEKISEYCDIAVVKIGSRGSLIKSKNNEIYKIEPISAVPADTTGAGDLYASGFFYGLVLGLPLDVCGNIGSLLAGKIVEVIGAKLDDNSWEEIKKDIKKIINS